MFLKPFRVKSQTAIKGSDRKRLRGEVSKLFTVDAVQLTDVVPNKEDMTVMKLYTHSGGLVVVYNVLGNPAFFEFDNVLYPTVYTLWRFPELLPTFTTWPPVFDKFLSGADLMLPGVIVKGEVTPNFMGRMPRGTSCVIKLLGNKAPVAVGRTALSTEDMYGANMRGKGVNILHSYKDQLWAFGTKAVPPQIDDPEMLEVVEKSSKLIEDEAVADDDEDHAEEVDDADAKNASTDDEQQADAVHAAAEQLEEMAVNDQEVEPPGAEGGEEEEDDDPRSPQERMDELLTWCFMCAVRSRVKKSDLPLLTSNFFRNHVQPCCPPGQPVDVKKSSYKKLTKFLKAMQDRGYIKVKELSKGVESITELHKEHPDIRAFTVPDQPEDPEPVTPATSAPDHFVPPKLVEMFTITAASLPFFKFFGYRKGTALTLQDIRRCLMEYVKENQLQSAIKGLVVLDPILADLLLTKGEYLEDVPWENVMTRAHAKMSPAYSVTIAGQQSVVKKGKLEPVSFMVEQRGGNKKVTIVHNVECFGVDPHEFAHRVQIGVACSVAVSERPGKTQGFEILIQGNQINYASNLLLDKYQIPKKYFRGMEKAPKGKKKR